MVNTMGWNERSDPDMRTANFCDVYREGVYIPVGVGNFFFFSIISIRQHVSNQRQ